jgi:hypothetical protein
MSSSFSPFVASIIGRAPYVAVLIIALYFWLVHPRRWTRGMNLFGIGIIGSLLLTLISPAISMLFSRGFSASGGSMNPAILILGQLMIQSLMAAVPLGFLLYGGFELARERDEDDQERDAERR